MSLNHRAYQCKKKEKKNLDNTFYFGWEAITRKSDKIHELNLNYKLRRMAWLHLCVYLWYEILSVLSKKKKKLLWFDCCTSPSTVSWIFWRMQSSEATRLSFNHVSASFFFKYPFQTQRFFHFQTCLQYFFTLSTHITNISLSLSLLSCRVCYT